MKKYILIIIILNCLTVPIKANELIEVSLSKCVDGDTAWFMYHGNKEKFRFLAIDAPESTTNIELYGKEASEFVCSQLTNASKIEIEFDDNSAKKDKYNRYLVWIYVDDELLQKKILSKGLAEVKYIYGDYKYLEDIKKVQKEAKKNKIGIWSEDNDNEINYIYVGFILTITIVVYITNKKYRNKINRRLKKKIKKKYKSYN